MYRTKWTSSMQMFFFFFFKDLEHLLTRVNLNVFKFEFEHFYLDTCELEHFYLDTHRSSQLGPKAAMSWINSSTRARRSINIRFGFDELELNTTNPFS
jgi:hypothetical protein